MTTKQDSLALHSSWVNRRSFLRAGVLCFGFNWLSTQSAEAPAQNLPGSLKNNPRLDAWLKLHPDGRVTMLTGKVELGQGILTALTQIVADELDVDLDSIQVISGDTLLTPNEGVTSGSLSIQDSGTALRFACAEVRAMLFEAASKTLNVPASALQATAGVIKVNPSYLIQNKAENAAILIPPGTEQSVTYAQLLPQVNYATKASAKYPPKTSSTHRFIGLAQQRRDIPGKLTGQPMYVQDLRLPHMVHARVVRPISARAKLLHVDTSIVTQLPGVLRVVRDGNFIGVIATREEQAINAAIILKKACTWQQTDDLPPTGSQLFEYMQQQPTQDDVVSYKSNPKFESKSNQVFKSRFTRPYLAHASIGPSCAVALWEDFEPKNDQSIQLKVWCHSQGVYPLRGDLSKALRIAPEHIAVSHVEGSGCYGHNAADDVALDAALLAKEMKGKPVRVQWMREDEFSWEPYGSPMVVELAAQLDESGCITHWEHELWSYTHSTRPYDPDGCNLLASWHIQNPLNAGPSRNIPQPAGGSDRNAIPLYDFPNQKVTNHLIKHMPIRTSALRTLGAFCNVLAIESFMDELAVQSAQDPIAFRIKHLKDQRAIAVLNRVSEMAQWSPKLLQKESKNTGHNSKNTGELRGVGVGFAKYKNLSVYCAVVAQVLVNRQNKTIRVERAYAAADAGLIINPDGLKNQIEGGMIQALSWSLLEPGIRYNSKQIQTLHWGDYSILRFPSVPLIEVELINRPNEKSLGVGEGAHGPMAAAVANAIYDACSIRLRNIPLTLSA
jgi:CO/xanthine dehydrogenase Mo-binding subunit